ncbi:Lar family restriction alleviation protein [Sphingomonas olei]|uniref:Lar family restriction alleviation protein n=1 Tax=Sphingomonas olei TaxID=1886787 RepID=UPI0014559B58|nr:Lar family restriction alleviation protein [Sphingomonas olei]
MADTVSELLPCPFCGATPTGVQYGSYELCDGWNVSCTGAKDCPLFYATPYRVWDSMAEAITAWNTRASTHPAPAFPREEVARTIYEGLYADKGGRWECVEPRHQDQVWGTIADAIAALLQGKQP